MLSLNSSREGPGANASNSFGFSKAWRGCFTRGEWVQRTASGRELQVKRFGSWLVRYWLDEPVLEIRIVDIEKISP
jgi:hypothetical protein